MQIQPWMSAHRVLGLHVCTTMFTSQNQFYWARIYPPKMCDFFFGSVPALSNFTIFFSDVGDWTQGLLHVRQVPWHWVNPFQFFKFYLLTFYYLIFSYMYVVNFSHFHFLLPCLIPMLFLRYGHVKLPKLETLLLQPRPQIWAYKMHTCTMLFSV